MTEPLPPLLQVVAALGHAVFVDGLFNLNIVGIRSAERRAGAFDDRLCVVCRDEGGWLTRTWSITTDPGRYHLRLPMRVEGTAILLPGQYRGAYVIGEHKGYAALVQDRPVRHVRDNDRNAVLDLDQAVVHEGVIGANIHAADVDPFDDVDVDRTDVGRWSAACQVFGSSADYRAWWELVQRAAARWGPRFTYTLIDESALLGVRRAA